MPKLLPIFATAIAYSLLMATGCHSTALRRSCPSPVAARASRGSGVRAGESVDVTLRGTDLEGAHTLWFDHPGLRAFLLKGSTFRVVCATGTPVGHHDVRVVGPYGVSNPRAFVVGDRPEVVEVEPNNTPEQANPIEINSVVNGEIAGTDVDVFAFDGKKGQRLLLDLAAERLESRLDATLRVLGPDGHEIAENRDSFGADPFLDLTLPADGRYAIKVHDVAYNGSPDHGYRLTIHDGPHLDAIVPAVAPAGVATIFTLIGRNLGGQAAPDLVADGRPLERKQVILTPPPSDPDPSAPTLGFVPSAASTRRGFEYVLRGSLRGRPPRSSSPRPPSPSSSSRSRTTRTHRR